MTVPFDPKPSADLLSYGFDTETWNAAMVVYGAALTVRDYRTPLTTHAHHRGSCFVKLLRESLAAYEGAIAESPVHRMVDGDLWRREPAVMTAADLGIEEQPR